MKRMLYISNVSRSKMNYGFSGSAIEAAHALGYEFYSVANRSNSSQDNIRQDELKYNIKLLHIDLVRNPFSLQNIVAYKQLVRIIREGDFELIHCNTPIGGLLGRLAGRRCKVKRIIYQAHGFHFYKGAPLKNWLLFYPVEKLCSYFTDVLITINREDYALAQRKMKAKKVVYVPGVGIDLEKFRNDKTDMSAKRIELGIPAEANWALNIGELIPRKNHETLIRAVAQIENLHLTIAGQGPLKNQLASLIKELGIANRVQLLGYRLDISDLCNACDFFVFPSFHEGLPVSVMEAMACGLPVACSRIRGNTDLIDENGGALFDPHSVEDCRRAIEALLQQDMSKISAYNLEKIKQFELNRIISFMKDIYNQ